MDFLSPKPQWWKFLFVVLLLLAVYTACQPASASAPATEDMTGQAAKQNHSEHGQATETDQSEHLVALPKIVHNSIGADFTSSSYLIHQRNEALSWDPFGGVRTDSGEYQKKFGPWSDKGKYQDNQRISGYRATESAQSTPFTAYTAQDAGARPGSLVINQQPIARDLGGDVTLSGADVWGLDRTMYTENDKASYSLGQIQVPLPFSLNHPHDGMHGSMPLCSATLANAKGMYPTDDWGVTPGPTNLEPAVHDDTVPLYNSATMDNESYCLVPSANDHLSCSVVGDDTKTVFMGTHNIIDIDEENGYGARVYRERPGAAPIRVDLKNHATGGSNWADHVWKVVLGLSKLYWHSKKVITGSTSKRTDIQPEVFASVADGDGVVSTATDHNALLPFWTGKSWSYLEFENLQRDNSVSATRADTWMVDMLGNNATAHAYKQQEVTSTDLKVYQSPADRLLTCRRACDSTEACEAFTFDTKSKTCHLLSKSNIEGLTWIEEATPRTISIKQRQNNGIPLIPKGDSDTAAAEWELHRLAVQMIRKKQGSNTQEITVEQVRDQIHAMLHPDPPSPSVCRDGGRVVGNAYYESEYGSCDNFACRVKTQACLFDSAAQQRYVLSTQTTAKECEDACRQSQDCISFYYGAYPQLNQTNALPECPLSHHRGWQVRLCYKNILDKTTPRACSMMTMHKTCRSYGSNSFVPEGTNRCPPGSRATDGGKCEAVPVPPGACPAGYCFTKRTVTSGKWEKEWEESQEEEKSRLFKHRAVLAVVDDLNLEACMNECADTTSDWSNPRKKRKIPYLSWLLERSSSEEIKTPITPC